MPASNFGLLPGKAVSQFMQAAEKAPALFHVTHAKAGSTWIASILQETFGERVFPRFGSRSEQYQWIEGAVYPAIFLGYGEFQELPRGEDSRVFYLVRDLRDTIVSLYFSLRYTHTETGFPHVRKFREEMAGQSDEEALQLLFRNRALPMARKQKSWLDAGEVVVRYEDLIACDGELLPEVFDQIDMPFDRRKLDRAIRKCRFENVYGRKLGERDNTSHGRQGLPGDWKNFAGAELLDSVSPEVGEIIRQAGYEVP